MLEITGMGPVTTTPAETEYVAPAFLAFEKPDKLSNT